MRLRACPFCGGYAKLERHSKTVVRGETARTSYVRCTVCDARGARFLHQEFLTPSDAFAAAVDAWNGRVKEDNHERV